MANYSLIISVTRWWSGGAMVLGKLPVPGHPAIRITVGQGPTALTVGADGGCLYIFILVYPFSPLSPSLWETARYRLKYYLKGPLNTKQPTNQPISVTPSYLEHCCPIENVGSHPLKLYPITFLYETFKCSQQTVFANKSH